MDARLLYKLFVALMLTTTTSGFSATLECLISKEQIQQRVAEIAHQIDKDYAGKEVVLVMVMKGAVCITADLLRALETPTTLECIKASSYGQGGTERGALTVTGLDALDLKEKHVLLVDDIYDSGETLSGILKWMQAKHPKSIKTLVLLVKDRKRATAYLPDYVLFHVKDRFIVGYGLDYKEQHRGLDGIYAFPQGAK